MTPQQLSINEVQAELALLEAEVPFLTELVQKAPFPTERLATELQVYVDKKSDRKARLEAALTTAMDSLPLVMIDVE